MFRLVQTAFVGPKVRSSPIQKADYLVAPFFYALPLPSDNANLKILSLSAFYQDAAEKAHKELYPVLIGLVLTYIIVSLYILQVHNILTSPSSEKTNPQIHSLGEALIFKTPHACVLVLDNICNNASLLRLR